MQLKHHEDMLCNARKFCIKELDEKKKTFDCGIIVVFQVTNVSSRSDRHPNVFDNQYYGYLNDILECDFKSFKLVMFDVKWYRLQMNECDLERTIIHHANRFTMVNSRLFELEIDRYVLPSQSKHVFYSKAPGRGVGHLFLDMIQEEIL